jgi:hypothetical protein
MDQIHDYQIHTTTATSEHYHCHYHFHFLRLTNCRSTYRVDLPTIQLPATVIRNGVC